MLHNIFPFLRSWPNLFSSLLFVIPQAVTQRKTFPGRRLVYHAKNLHGAALRTYYFIYNLYALTRLSLVLVCVLRSETNSASHLDAARFIHLIILMLSLFSLMVFSSLPRSFQIEMLLSAAHGVEQVLFYTFLIMANCYYSKIPLSDVPWRRVADEHQSPMHAFDDIATQFTPKPASVSMIC